MSDKIPKARSEGRERINISEPFRLSHWAKLFDVTPDQLRAAVKQVGNIRDELERYLRAERR